LTRKMIRVTGCQPFSAPPKFTGCPFHACFEKGECLPEEKDKEGKCWCSLVGKALAPNHSMTYIPPDCPLENLPKGAGRGPKMVRTPATPKEKDEAIADLLKRLRLSDEKER